MGKSDFITPPVFIPTTIAIVIGFALGIVCSREILSVASLLTVAVSQDLNVSTSSTFEKFVDAIMPLYAVLALSFVWDITYTRKLSNLFLDWRLISPHKQSQFSVKNGDDSTASSSLDAEEKENLEIPYEILPIQHPSQKINFTGTYKFIEAKNMGAILEAEGCPWVKRTIILNLKDLVQGIEHVPEENKLTLYRRSRVVTNKTYDYYFGGKIVALKQATGRTYNVTCDYINMGIRIICNDSKGDYVLVFTYVLSNSYPQLLVMYIKLTFPDGRSINAQRVFERISFNHNGS